MIKPIDQKRGEIVCTHAGCGKINQLLSTFYYDEISVQSLPEVGRLTNTSAPNVSYPLQFGQNVIGTSDTCTIRVERYLHKGRCFISRRHCTLTVTFDKWQGQFRYQLHDGAAEPGTYSVKNSLNGTFLNQSLLQPTENLDVPEGGIITLGGADSFRLTHYIIPPALLATFKIDAVYNPDNTQ